MKFSQMEYKRIEVEPTKEKLAQLLNTLKSADSADAAFAAYKEIDDFGKYVGTMFALGYIRHTLDTNDEFYDGENDFLDEIGPEFEPYWQDITKALLESPYRTEMEATWGTLMFDKAEMDLKTFHPDIVEDLQLENKLGTEYDKLIASAIIKFDSKQLTLEEMVPYYEVPDRNKRKAAMDAVSSWFIKNADELDRLFDELVRVRTKIAKTIGYDNFVELGYYRMERICYDRTKVEAFREGVVKYIVPITTKLKMEQAARIGVPTIKPHDNFFLHPDGNAKPTGTPGEIFTHGKKMYHEMSEDTAKFIDFMMESELFDVLTRPGKSAGGYCYNIDLYNAPFIFANFNGTSGDIDVLTHEAGHAFAAYEARDIYPSDLQDYTAEVAEVHSMAMEFFAWPWMEGFFGNTADKYRKDHLAAALVFLPYGCMVDEYQHKIYEDPTMTPAERNAYWLTLEAKYRPYLDKEGNDFYSSGRFWQRQAHIYENPFYYIDYCLAQIAALSFWAESQKDYAAAWDKYRTLVKMAGTKPFSDLLTDAGLASPFVAENLKPIADEAVKWLG